MVTATEKTKIDTAIVKLLRSKKKKKEKEKDEQKQRYATELRLVRKNEKTGILLLYVHR